jgi:hypothetical protein
MKKKTKIGGIKKFEHVSHISIDSTKHFGSIPEEYKKILKNLYQQQDEKSISTIDINTLSLHHPDIFDDLKKKNKTIENKENENVNESIIFVENNLIDNNKNNFENNNSNTSNKLITEIEEAIEVKSPTSKDENNNLKFNNIDDDELRVSFIDLRKNKLKENHHSKSMEFGDFEMEKEVVGEKKKFSINEIKILEDIINKKEEEINNLKIKVESLEKNNNFLNCMVCSNNIRDIVLTPCVCILIFFFNFFFLIFFF